MTTDKTFALEVQDQILLSSDLNESFSSVYSLSHSGLTDLRPAAVPIAIFESPGGGGGTDYRLQTNLPSGSWEGCRNNDSVINKDSPYGVLLLQRIYC